LSKTIQIEFYGVPRQRSGVPQATIALASSAPTLGAALRELGARFPQLIGECIEADGRLKPGYVVNLDGQNFVRDPHTPLSGVGTILFLSADAGG
jgi:molybdopterin converting factor small subunit